MGKGQLLAQGSVWVSSERKGVRRQVGGWLLGYRRGNRGPGVSMGVCRGVHRGRQRRMGGLCLG